MAHSSTIFSQVLQLIDRHAFRKLEEGGFAPRRKYRKLTRWAQFAAMMFAHVTGRTSLRDLESQFEAQSSKLYHAGAGKVRRSTLADANNKRPAEFFQALFSHMYGKCQATAPGHKFRFKNKLYSMDSSVVDLCLSLFSWAEFRKKKGGVKIHTVLDHSGNIPSFIHITDAKTSDISVARTLNLEPGSILAVDRAYIEFAWFHALHLAKLFFVTRMKKNIKYKVIDWAVPPKNSGVLSDETIVLTGPKAKDCPIKLRRVEYEDPESKKRYVYLTNILHLSPKTIADIYKDRWQIELFFKWIKQNLRIKSFMGNSKNAVLTQIWIAMIAVLLLAYYKWKAKLGHSMTQILKLLQLTLMDRRNLYELFHPPDNTPKSQPQNQLLLNFNDF